MNYLKVHPATQAWWDQRDQCRACRHLSTVDNSALRCRATRQDKTLARMQAAHAVRGIHYLHCIDARSEDGPCGPEARLYEAKE